MSQLDHAAPYSYQGAPKFFVGKNRRGHWVVQDRAHRRGGLFIDRVAALRYVKDEAGDGSQIVAMVRGFLELDLNGDQFRDLEAADGPPRATDQIAERYCIAQDLI